MARPRKKRCCRRYQADRVYKPQGIPLREIGTVELSLDQFEALRLCYAEGRDQSEAGQQMGVSRGTVQRLLHAARKQLVEAILRQDAIVINLQEREACHAGMHTDARGRRARGFRE
jgi:predicted DNA-binding protein (UPF0251 family)